MYSLSADCKLTAMNERSIRVCVELDRDSEQIRGVVSDGGARRPFIGWLALASQIEAMRREQATEKEEGDA